MSSNSTGPARLRERLQHLIAQEPGQTERELTARLCGVGAGPARLNFWCKLLIDRGVVFRHGSGGRLDPYRYVPVTDGVGTVRTDLG